MTEGSASQLLKARLTGRGSTFIQGKYDMTLICFEMEYLIETLEASLE